MEKEEFLRKLEIEFQHFSVVQVKAIIKEQEEIVDKAVSLGRSEKMVIRSLGDPKLLAEKLIKKYKLKESEPKVVSKVEGPNFRSLGAFLVLIPLNLFLFIVPGLFIISFLLSWLVGGGVFLFISAMGLTSVLLIGSSSGVSWAAFLGGVFLCLGGGSLAIAGIILLFQLLKVCMKYLVIYMNWNLKFIRRGVL